MKHYKSVYKESTFDELRFIVVKHWTLNNKQKMKKALKSGEIGEYVDEVESYFKKLGVPGWKYLQVSNFISDVKKSLI